MLKITLRQLQVFASVARNLSYTAAARELHLSQPGVSMQVRQLEEAVGLPLFEQLGKKIYLTDAGRHMQEYSRSLEDLLDEAEGVFDSLRGVESGHLSVSVATTASYFATRLLAAWSKQHQDVSINLDVTNRQSLQQQLEANEPDLVIMGHPPPGVQVDADALMKNPLVMIAAPDHELVGERNIPLDRFASESFVVREPGSGTRNATQRFFDTHGVPFNKTFIMTRNDAIKQAVEAGLGLGIVSQHTIELELETGHLHTLDVAGFPIMRTWYIVRRKGKRLSPAAESFRLFALEQAERYIHSPFAATPGSAAPQAESIGQNTPAAPDTALR